MKTGPIIIIEDDTDDKEIMVEAIRELGYDNDVIWFKDCIKTFKYLKATMEQPFIIFSDVNLPLQSGIEFKIEVDQDPDLRKKCIPFIFYSTSANQDLVNTAYIEITVQGFFKKSGRYEDIVKDMEIILRYWTLCRHPNSV